MKGVHKVQNPPSSGSRRVVVERVSVAAPPAPATAREAAVLPMRKVAGRAGRLDKVKETPKAGEEEEEEEEPSLYSERSATAEKSRGRRARSRNVEKLDAVEETSARTRERLLDDGRPVPREGQAKKRKGGRGLSLSKPKKKRAREESEDDDNSEEGERCEGDRARDSETNSLTAGNDVPNGHVIVKFSFRNGRPNQKC